MPGTAARQIRGEVDRLCLESWVVHWESCQCCKFLRGRSSTEGARDGNHLYRSHTSEAVSPQEKTLGTVPLFALACVLACPGVGDMHKNIFAQFNA